MLAKLQKKDKASDFLFCLNLYGRKYYLENKKNKQTNTQTNQLHEIFSEKKKTEILQPCHKTQHCDLLSLVKTFFFKNSRRICRCLEF